MNLLDDHDAPFDELSELGKRVRTDAAHRPPDLAGLGRRISASRQRARLAVVAGCAVVVLVLAGVVGLRAEDQALRVGDEGPGGVPLVTETVPRWTVNPSMALDPADGEVWAVEVVYDPAQWTFSRFSDDPALRDVLQVGATHGYGMSGYRGEPRMQIYWQGRESRLVAEAAREALVGRAGIVSVEVGPAEPTSYHPGTGPVGTGP